MIKTIIFDLGGVYFTNGTNKAYEEISKKYNIPYDKVREPVKESSETGGAYRRGEITVDEFWKKVKAHWGIDAPNEEITDLWISCYDPIQGTVSVIKKLRNSGYKVLFLTNNVKERALYLDEKYHYIENFDDGVFSFKVGITKPDPRIFQLALEKAACKAEECIYIDDKEKNLNPAEELGMKTIAFESPEQLEAELKELGVEF